jgi:hypothetical protein
MIGIDGEIYPCCYLYGSLDKVNPAPHFDEYVDGKNNRIFSERYRLGNIFKDDVYKIWNCRKELRIREKVRTPHDQDISYEQLRSAVDATEDYCRICAVRWGKKC